MGLLSSDSHLWLTPVKVRHLLHRAARDAESAGNAPPKKPDPKAIHIHKLQHRLGEPQIQQLTQEYELGTPASALAKRYGIGKSSILRVLHERGIPVRPRGRYW